MTIKFTHHRLTSADGRELGVEPGGQAGPPGRPDQQVPLVAVVLYPGSDPEPGVRRQQGGVGRLLRLPAGGRAVLADEVELEVAVGVRPEPPLGAVEAGAVVAAAGQVPEGDRHRAPAHPAPGLGVGAVAHRAQPVLPVGVALQTPDRNRQTDVLYRSPVFFFVTQLVCLINHT